LLLPFDRLFTEEVFLSEKEELVVMEQARALCASIEAYSGAKGSREQSKRYTEILDFFNREANKVHANDLFVTNQYGSAERNIIGYLAEIDADYQNAIDVSYSGFEVQR